MVKKEKEKGELEWNNLEQAYWACRHLPVHSLTKLDLLLQYVQIQGQEKRAKLLSLALRRGKHSTKLAKDSVLSPCVPLFSDVDEKFWSSVVGDSQISLIH